MQHPDRTSFGNAIPARIDGKTIPISPLEPQVAYELHFGVQNDVGDAVHPYTLSEKSVSVPRLEEWVARLDVEDEYGRLKRA